MGGTQVHSCWLWSGWNTPAHRWLDRHVYKPLLHPSYDKWQARLAVFLLSVCFCEIPLSCLWKWLLTATRVTCLCGISLVRGPPLTVPLYFQDYYIIHC
ncbi:diacylglycerol O-acyltransferase 1-like isoform 1-T1 [Pluvialis apricaria]